MLKVALSIRAGDGVGVVVLRGEFDLADAPGVASRLITAVAVCGPSVIVDLADLEGIGYSGLSVLLRIRKWTRANGGDLPLARPQPPVRRMLEATGLIDVFSVYPSVDEAAGGARRFPARLQAVPRRFHAAVAPRCGARPAGGHKECRSRYMARDICVIWRSPGGRTAGLFMMAD